MDRYDLCATCLFGLEGLAAEQLRKLGMSNVRAENGRVLFTGSKEDIAKASVNIRFAERLLIRAGTFNAVTFTELFDKTRELDWERYIPVDACFPVKGTCVNSALHSEPDCQSIIKKAVASRLMSKYRTEWMEEKAEKYQIRFTILRDTVDIYIDTSGQALHKRGYRAEGTAAPLRETLAAALVELARFRGKGEFLDPFCGSGTIPIEAALMALNRAPGLNRAFDAMNWRWMPKKLWPEAREEARSREFKGEYKIFGSDIDENALRIARSNASKAGVGNLIDFSRCDAASLPPRRQGGTLIANPPYGERMMARSEAAKLIEAFGRCCAAFEGWKFYVLTADTDFERSFGRKADKKRKLYNGMIKCDLYMYL
ncbi:MAG: class I SAM-dependent RNA methyltransferase [Clostridiales bacterium]|jgi:putative N6-adenine-specific DNA methylase|nr:class I SAM-dependent RNA methyltransferase [Clostridiales bacterium]